MDEYLYLGYTVQQMAFSLFWISVPDQPHDVAHVLLLDGRVLVREDGKICEVPQHERARLPPACDAHRYAVKAWHPAGFMQLSCVGLDHLGRFWRLLARPTCLEP